jgi:gamma-glutamyl hercynylcysteine S-oxide synthase
MKEEKKITQSDIEQAKVRLHPIAGISPRSYLPAFYAALIVVLLFLLLVLPGIRKNGSYLAFEGKPGKSAVYVDDSFKGSTDQKIFLPSGTCSVRIAHEGFSSETQTLKVGGKLFGSLFFPGRLRVKYNLAADKPEAYLRSAFDDYAEWSLAGKPSALYQIPLVLSDAATAVAGTSVLKDSARFSKAGAAPTSLDFARDVLSATASAESAKDGLKAGIIISASGTPSPLGFASAARTMTAALASQKAGAVWLQDILPKKSGAAAESLGKTIQSAVSSLGAAALGVSALGGTQLETAAHAVGIVHLGDHDFVLFPSGKYPMGGEAPSGSKAGYTANLPRFGIARTEVTNRQWTVFMAANREWLPANKPALIEKGLADSGYLAEWKGNGDDKPVTGVSWFAAQAYCDWLTALAGGSWKAVLPDEAMWESAARAGLSTPSSPFEKKAVWSSVSPAGPARAASLGYASTGLADMFGNVWEWTADSYRPYPAFASGLLQSGEKTVRGGSWANAQDSISLYSRGGTEAAHSSAFLGFRPAIVQR